MREILITRPWVDVPTSYLYKWGEQFIKFANDHNFKIIDLPKEKATRREVEERIKKLKPRFLFFNGHGDESSIEGQNEIIVAVSENEEILQGSITYSLTCNSAKVLGEKAVEKGCDAFVGYERPFFLLNDDNMCSRPLEDKIAEPFLDSAFTFPKMLVKGHTVGESVEKTLERFKRWLEKFLTTETTFPISVAIVRYLLWDMISLVLKGEKEARL